MINRNPQPFYFEFTVASFSLTIGRVNVDRSYIKPRFTITLAKLESRSERRVTNFYTKWELDLWFWGYSWEKR